MRRAELHRQVLQVLVDLPDADPGRLVHHAWLAGDQEAVLRFGQIAAARPPRAGCPSGGGPALPGGGRLRRAPAGARSTPSCSSATPTRRTWPAPTRRRCRPGERALADLGTAGSGRADRREPAVDLSAGLVDRPGDPDAGGGRPRAGGACRPAAEQGAGHGLRRPGAAPLPGEPPGRVRGLGRPGGRPGASSWGRARSRCTPASPATPPGSRPATSPPGRRWSRPTRSARDAGLVDPAARALGSLATVVADELARYAEAEELVERSLAFSAEHSLDGLYLPILAARATLRLERGDWTGALADAESVLARGGEHRTQRGAGPGRSRADPGRPGRAGGAGRCSTRRRGPPKGSAT